MKINFRTSKNPVAREAFDRLTKRYKKQRTSLPKADVVVSLGGDGTTLGVLTHCLESGKPVFGLNYGTLGFLQNARDGEDNLVKRIDAAERFTLSALRADVEFTDGTTRQLFAANEIFVFNRKRTQTVHLQLSINGQTYCPLLEGDGVIVSTAVGSSAYNYSAGGGIVSLDKDVMIVTPNNQCHRGNKIPSFAFDSCVVDIEVINPDYRPAGITADGIQITKKIKHVRVTFDREKKFTLLFDPGYNLQQRVLRTQFPQMKFESPTPGVN